MNIQVNIGNDALARFGARLGALGDGKGRQLLSSALNKQGNKIRTEIRSVLVEETGITPSGVIRATSTTYSSTNTLMYRLTARAGETNIGAFGAKQQKTGVKAAPWNKLRVFPHSFLMKAVKGVQGAVGLQSLAKGKLVAFVRTGPRRGDFRNMFGPNLARELIRAKSKGIYSKGAAALADEIERQLQRTIS